ncbi:hypothetical protein QFZ35_002935 [Arthrobacter ulcerisalmonis]|nr:hypothetical protein [Arthrobacter ulcerisalmonis]MDQ0664437.1 hypothetical protein [Arthrobacter ulcerisalmonis]
MRRREIWGVPLLAAAAVVAVCYLAVDSADREASRQGLLLYVGVRASNLVYGLMFLASFMGAVGLVFLIPALIRRITRKALRITVGWTTGVAVAAALPYLAITLTFALIGAVGLGDDVKIVATDGQSVLITQDGFDGDSVVIYTGHDEFHYKRTRDAPEIAGWPRVKDQGCRLATDDGLTLTCGATSLKVDE